MFPSQLILVLSQLQTSIINILALDGTIACAPPFSSQARGSSKKNLQVPSCEVTKKRDRLVYLSFSVSCSLPAVLSQQLMIMEMFIITLITRILYRRTYDSLPTEAHDNNHNANVLMEHDV